MSEPPEEKNKLAPLPPNFVKDLLSQLEVEIQRHLLHQLAIASQNNDGTPSHEDNQLNDFIFSNLTQLEAGNRFAKMTYETLLYGQLSNVKSLRLMMSLEDLDLPIFTSGSVANAITSMKSLQELECIDLSFFPNPSTSFLEAILNPHRCSASNTSYKNQVSTDKHSNGTVDHNSLEVDHKDKSKDIFEKVVNFPQLKVLDLSKLSLNENDTKYLLKTNIKQLFPSLTMLKVGPKAQFDNSNTIYGLGQWIQGVETPIGQERNPLLESNLSSQPLSNNNQSSIQSLCSTFGDSLDGNKAANLTCKPDNQSNTPIDFAPTSSDRHINHNLNVSFTYWKINQRDPSGEKKKNELSILSHPSSLMSTITSFTAPQSMSQTEAIELLQSDPVRVNDRINALDLFLTTPITNQLISLLSHTPTFSNLSSLFISTSSWAPLDDITDDSIRLIAESPYLGQMKELGMPDHCNEISDNALKTLFNSPNMAHLTHFSISHAGSITSLALKHIADSKCIGNMKKLTLNHHNFSDNNNFHHFCQSINLSNLTSLSLKTSKLTHLSLISIAQSPSLTNLEHLDLSWNHLVQNETEGDEESFEKGTVTGEKVKNDEQNQKEKWSEIFFSSPNLSHLTSLNLTGCGLTDNDLFHLAQSPYLSNLIELRLGSNNFSDVGVKYLIKSNFLSKLTVFDISENLSLTRQTTINLSNATGFVAHLSLILIHTLDDDELEFQFNTMSKSGWFNGMWNFRPLGKPFWQG